MVVLEGTFDAWLDGLWQTYGPGETIEIRPDVRHALKNEGPDDVSLVLVTTSRMASFFSKLSGPQDDCDMSQERLGHFSRTAAAYGHWSGNIQEQAAIGIILPEARPE